MAPRWAAVRCLAPDQGLAGSQARHGHAAPHPGCSVCRSCAEREMVDRSRPHLDRQGRLGFTGPGDRLPHPRAVGLPSVEMGQGRDGQRRPRACADREVRHPGPGRGGVPAEVGQWHSPLGSNQWRRHGSVFTSRTCTAPDRSHGRKQALISPHGPQQNGMVTRVIRILKERCIHRQRLDWIRHATRAIGNGLFGRCLEPMAVAATLCNNCRPRRALAMRTPAQAFGSAVTS